MKRLMMWMALLASTETIGLNSPAEAADAIDTGLLAQTPLTVGDPIGAFRVVKVAGAIEDGLDPGDELCYRCRYGSRPMVLVFAQENSEALVNLTEQLNQALLKHREEKMHGLLTFFGDESPALQDRAETFAKAIGESLIPIVIAKDARTGPTEYRLSRNDEVIVIVAIDSQVFANLSGSANKIDSDAVTEAIESMLANEDE